MTPLIRFLAVLSLLLAGVPAVAQPSRPPIPPEMLVPNEEARAWFEVLESRIFTVADMAEIPPQVRALADTAVGRILRLGDTVPDWQQRGVDFHAMLAAREGGLAASMATTPGSFGPELVYFADRRLDGLAPREWALVARHGQPFEAELVQIEVIHASPKLIFIERVGYRRQGKAICRERAESRLYSDPRVAASDADLFAFAMTLALLARLDRTTLCHTTEEMPDGGYVTRAYDPQGRGYAQLNANTRPFRLVPSAPLAARPIRP